MSRKKETEVEVNYSEDVQETEKKSNGQTADNTNESASGNNGQDVKKDTKSEEKKDLTREEELQIRVAELEDKLLRNMAEFENYKKRTARQFDEMVRSANDRIVVEILEIIDNFERAMEHSDKDANSDAFRKGIELIYNQLLSLLGKYEIEAIDAVGKTFDPNLHEAMMQVESDEHDDGVVAMEIVRGYKQGERIIRHSKVGVSKGKPENKDKESDSGK